MEFIRPAAAEAKAGLGAMCAVGECAEGQLDPATRDFLGAVQVHLLGSDFDLDGLERTTPEAMAQVLRPELGQQFINGMVILLTASGEVEGEAVDLVGTYAAALGVADKHLSAMRKLADHRLLAFRLDYLRTVPQVRDLVQRVKDKTWRQRLTTASALLGKTYDAATAEPLQQLGLLPDNTVGRQYWQFCRSRRFPFAGEPGGVPLTMMRHDLSHVLGGYGTSSTEEINVNAFSGGYSNIDGISAMLFAIFMYHVGVPVTFVAETERHRMDPDAMMRAYKRGLAMTHDMFQPDWDPMSIVERDVDEVRAEFNIQPRDDVPSRG